MFYGSYHDIVLLLSWQFINIENCIETWYNTSFFWPCCKISLNLWFETILIIIKTKNGDNSSSQRLHWYVQYVHSIVSGAHSKQRVARLYLFMTFRDAIKHGDMGILLLPRTLCFMGTIFISQVSVLPAREPLR